MILTAQRREPSFFQARAVMVYRLGISLGEASSQVPRRGLQLKTLNLTRNTTQAYTGETTVTDSYQQHLVVKPKLLFSLKLECKSSTKTS